MEALSEKQGGGTELMFWVFLFWVPPSLPNKIWWFWSMKLIWGFSIKTVTLLIDQSAGCFLHVLRTTFVQ